MGFPLHFCPIFIPFSVSTWWLNLSIYSFCYNSIHIPISLMNPSFYCIVQHRYFVFIVSYFMYFFFCSKRYYFTAFSSAFGMWVIALACANTYVIVAFVSCWMCILVSCGCNVLMSITVKAIVTLLNSIEITVWDTKALAKQYELLYVTFGVEWEALACREAQNFIKFSAVKPSGTAPQASHWSTQVR